MKSAFKAAFPLTIPVMAGYVFLGLTYGILMASHGFPFWLPMLTALIIYTGSMEFLTIDILLSSFHPISAFATALMVGARHLFYGISMLEKYNEKGIGKLYLIYSTSDETFAVNYSAKIPQNVDKKYFYLWVSFLDQMYWVFGSMMGGIFGSLITVNTKGLDFVMTAMFVVIFLNQWMEDGKTFEKGSLKNHASEIIGIGASILCLIIFGPDKFIIPTMICMLVALLVIRPILEGRGEKK